MIVFMEYSLAQNVKTNSFKILPITIGQSLKIGLYIVIPLEANHRGEYEGEIPLNYLLIKNEIQCVYAVDSAWILARTWDSLRKNKLDAFIVDCTIGYGRKGDYRIFEHNSINMVKLITETFMAQKILNNDGYVILTHMSKKLHPSQKKLDKTLKFPFKAAYDGYIHKIMKL